MLLSPRVGNWGSVELSSTRARWGGPGAYLVVDTARGCWARRIAVLEHFRVYVDDDDVLRTDHRLTFGSLPVLRLHYRLTPS
ncbi:MAG: hypothetical protein M3Y20_06610 [Actinomycetota bacterium]|nr:hypothetical protein [Actinomycetota bacterium]